MHSIIRWTPCSESMPRNAAIACFVATDKWMLSLCAYWHPDRGAWLDGPRFDAQPIRPDIAYWCHAWDSAPAVIPD